MKPLSLVLLCLSTFLPQLHALRYDPEQIHWNLNQNSSATDPMNYWGSWEDQEKHDYYPSPENWRFPFYTIFLDRFVNGDPTNDNANGSAYEHDLLSNQFRNGGDITGLKNSLDYLQGMGIKGLYVAGSPFINQPWAADSYSPLDLTLLDHHFGTIDEWREAITEIHRRGMYVLMDNTMSTLGDLIGFDGYLNTTTPFSFSEHKAVWKSTRRYHDFYTNDEKHEPCTYPRFWTETGERIGSNVTALMTHCLDSDFDQYGDVASFGVYPEWQKQLSKFGFVQDRLREWRPSVLDKIKHFSCMTIAMLDIDGFRIDKALTITLDPQAEWSEYVRECARRYNKTNFFIPGEIVSGNTLASLYIGRGREPHMYFSDPQHAMEATGGTNLESNVREGNLTALDAAVFHYSVYRSMTRFLGIDGVYAAEMDIRVNWADGWRDIVTSNDLVNVNTGKFDPRHFYGVTNQDVFRWPAIKNGTQKNILGLLITTLTLPGIPIAMWGEEQAFYVLENTAGNYLFGRSPMVSTIAWQLHGCYSIGSEKYYQWPIDAAIHGCEDDKISLDHRDPSHPVRNILRRMYELREIYPSLNDGFILSQLSNHTYDIYMPGSEGTPTETGLWSVVRAGYEQTQDFTGQAQGNQSVWLLFTNENKTVSYNFDCNNGTDALASPFEKDTTVRNLFYPYEEYTLGTINKTVDLGNSKQQTSCLSQLEMPAWGFKAFVPSDKWVGPKPAITRFIPGHDARLISTVAAGQQESVNIELHFSDEMDCNSIVQNIKITSETDDSSTAELDQSSVSCNTVSPMEIPIYSGAVATEWIFAARLTKVSNGIHAITVGNATNQAQNATLGFDSQFLFRIGQMENPMVFPWPANYSTSLLYKESKNDSLYVSHKAAGATLWRYSLDWASHWSPWQAYRGGNSTLGPSNWTGTKDQKWSGHHVQVQYWSNLTASSNHIQQGDLGNLTHRRFPHLYVHGPYNEYGYDAGLTGQMHQVPNNGTWLFDFMTEWPTVFQINEWGINPDGRPDQTMILGDVDGDQVLDRIPPGSLAPDIIELTKPPPRPHVGYRIGINDASLRYKMIPTGSSHAQVALFVLLALVPLLTASASVYTFMKSFYQVKFNEIGVTDKKPLIPLALRRNLKQHRILTDQSLTPMRERSASPEPAAAALQMDAGAPNRRTVLIATMEYDIEDWNIKIKIGGLGVMAQLMGKNLGHQDLIWVVPCVSGIDYPVDQVADPMFITILEKTYEVQVQYHVLRNITYVLLDAPVFRQQTKNEPYPARMDDLDSAIYYSAWNACVAEAIRRFPVDLYHINDYHGALAPLHLLPDVIPCALSLHNAEFQGLWPMRTPKERDEVCKVFNLDPEIAQRYVQFGDVFNLLHAGASYLRIHQKGFGAVGVSKKYGKRTFARYPIFWGLHKIGSLPNPDPTDTAEWTRDAPTTTDVTIDVAFEAGRGELKRQAQAWAGLKEDPNADLFVFVGRWSMQKGVDLIADVFPSILTQYPNVQLICIGPVIDLYGRFAALKLEKLMKLYPDRVYSKPEFTALPPYIFSGAEFALIPSRDEPFGLVAVEFGRKGALGVGSRVGGLGQMPGWWFTVESTTPKHLLHQFKMAINDALASSTEIRATMRARSAKQRFPVAQWVEDLNTLQSTAIRTSKEEMGRLRPLKSPSMQKLVSFVSGSSEAVNSRNSQSHLPPAAGAFLSPSIPGPGTPSTLGAPSPLLSPRHSPPDTPTMDSGYLQPRFPAGPRSEHLPQTVSVLSLDSVVGERTDFALQKVDPFFTDAKGEYYREFEKKLDHLGEKSADDLIIEEHLMKSEKKWFNQYRDAKMGKLPGAATSSTSFFGRGSRPSTPVGSIFNESPRASGEFSLHDSESEPFGLGADYQPPSGVRKFLYLKIGDWPIYSFLLAFGQIIAATSYQITLLTGEIGESATKLYVIATIYLVTSIMWWLLFRKLKAVYVLSLPFLFYGLAFIFIGVSPFAHSYNGRGWVQNIGTGLYTIASSSGSIFFASNFGDEGGAPVASWVFRSCVIQGTQQLYVAFLWYWGSTLSRMSEDGVETTTVTTSNYIVTSVTLPLAVLLWVVGLLLFFGLPKYYRQAPGTVPSFYRSLARRKIIGWFFISVLLQNYWLSAPYGRNWRYLWTTQHASFWQILLLLLFFFVGVWALVLFILGRLSKSHLWIMPVFAIGLGAPRWCQMLWGASGAASYLPWAGGYTAGALVGRGLWLWLGILDSLQGVGFGMILLQTMTRFHITFTLLAAQVLGSIATMVGRATAPDRLGPGTMFPNLALGASGLQNAWFWIAILFQLAICVGFFTFFRKEQLTKP
ncbi:glycosyltransferase family 5 protein [Xylona heveae TC161]|uniref:alpha-1,3-glucan synthase n=1 Tax=Xylona heveae (strain CBS 132557 / TC161) TaxID=1328760 RepID=A0A165JMJ0_XYLHT|nr:glycosyltransferase family 5 protein [Xylona heveae TC161]KZF26426.1 glycosyltransferase family 5 protein [Xylona heveae TC161]